MLTAKFIITIKGLDLSIFKKDKPRPLQVIGYLLFKIKKTQLFNIKS